MSGFLLFKHPGAALWRAVGFAAFWLVLVGPNLASWIVGGPAVAAATLASLKLSEPRARSLSLPGLARFIPFFLWESLRGGFDVAARVMLPRLRVQPGTTTYNIRLRNPTARLVFLDSISLLPGTLSADLKGDLLWVHALEITADVDQGLMDLEERVADLFGETLEPARIDASRVNPPKAEVVQTTAGLVAAAAPREHAG